jgi:hypothetical protein
MLMAVLVLAVATVMKEKANVKKLERENMGENKGGRIRIKMIKILEFKRKNIQRIMDS